MHSPELCKVPSPGSGRRAACLRCRGALPAPLPAPSTGQGEGTHGRGARGSPALHLRQGKGSGALGLVLVILDVNSIKKITDVKPGCVRCRFSRSRAGRSGQGGCSPSPSRAQLCPGVAGTHGCCSLHIWLVRLRAALPTPGLGRAPHIPLAAPSMVPRLHPRAPGWAAQGQASPERRPGGTDPAGSWEKRGFGISRSELQPEQRQPGAEPHCQGERERERRTAERGHGGSSCPDPAAKFGKRGACGGARGVRAVSPAQLLPPPVRMCQGRHPSAPASPAHRPGVPSWPGSSCRRAVTGQLRLVSQDAATAEMFPTAKIQSRCRARGSLASPSLPHAAPRPRSCSVPWPQSPPRWRCGASLAQPQAPATRKELADFFPLAGSLPGFYLVIPSKSLSKQYGFLTFFCGKVNSQHISNSRALLFFSGGCRGSALPRCASWAGCGTPVHSPQEENTGERSN